MVSKKSFSKYHCPFRTHVIPKARRGGALTNLGAFGGLIPSCGKLDEQTSTDGSFKVSGSL